MKSFIALFALIAVVAAHPGAPATATTILGPDGSAINAVASSGAVGIAGPIAAPLAASWASGPIASPWAARSIIAPAAPWGLGLSAW